MVAMSRLTISLATFSAVICSGLVSDATASDSFFKETSLRILIGHPPGGSYDFYARLAANHLPKFLPGNPRIIVEGRPGGGGVRAVQYFYSQAPRDGSTLGLFFHGIPNMQVLDPNLGRWKVEEMRYVGSMSPANNVFVINKMAKARTVDQMKTTETSVGCVGHASDTYQGAALLQKLGNFKLKTICGYPGSAETMIAIARGEVDMVSANWSTLRVTHSASIKDGTLNPVFQFGLARMKDIPQVPLMQDLIDDPEARAIIDFASGGSAIGRALSLPPSVPEERVRAYQAAFDKMVTDPDFLAEAAKRQLDVEPRSGQATQDIAVQIVTAPKQIIDRAREIMN